MRPEELYVGQQVMVRQDLRDFDPDEYPKIVEDMYDLCGSVFTVSEGDVCRSLYGELIETVDYAGYVWLPKWLEPVHDEPADPPPELGDLF